jgi:glycosyltransferase involved in cell wall biosynthesis
MDGDEHSTPPRPGDGGERSVWYSPLLTSAPEPGVSSIAENDRGTRTAAQATPLVTRLVHVVTHPVTARYLLRDQLAWLRERGFDVWLVASPGADLEVAAAHEEVWAVAVPMRRRPAPLADVLALLRLVRLFRRLRPQIVHAGTPKAGLLALLAARWCGVPVRVYGLRGLRLEGTAGAAQAILARLERLAAASAHRILAVSPSLRQRYLELGLAPPEKVTVLASGSSNGVDLVRFRPAPEARAERREALGIPPDAPVVGFVGRLVGDKGVADLLAALELVWERLPSARLLAVGEVERGDAVPEAVRHRLEGDERFVLAGWVTDAAPLYAAMDVLCFPSRREGFPNAPLEAAACGVPTVAYAATGTVDAVVDGETGALVDPGDVAGLAAALLRYWDDPDLRHAHGDAARRRAEAEFPRERVWRALETEYRRLLAERGLAAPTPRST